MIQEDKEKNLDFWTIDIDKFNEFINANTKIFANDGKYKLLCYLNGSFRITLNDEEIYVTDSAEDVVKEWNLIVSNLYA